MAKLKRELTLEERIARGGLTFDVNDGMTEQHHAEDADINNIMKRYRNTGLVPVNPNIPLAVGDFSEIDNYESAMNKIAEANSMFEQLPAHIRKAYDNNPALLLAAIDDPNQKQKLTDLGVFEKSPATPDNVSRDAPVAPEGG